MKPGFTSHEYFGGPQPRSARRAASSWCSKPQPPVPNPAMQANAFLTSSTPSPEPPGMLVAPSV
jgi:hypothetical protein